jgi:hypothetical protein
MPPQHRVGLHKANCANRRTIDSQIQNRRVRIARAGPRVPALRHPSLLRWTQMLGEQRPESTRMTRTRKRSTAPRAIPGISREANAHDCKTRRRPFCAPQQGRAPSAHKSKAYEGYAKRTPWSGLLRRPVSDTHIGSRVVRTSREQNFRIALRNRFRINSKNKP